MDKKDRFLYIDALRGITALVVVLHHYLFIYGRDFNSTQCLPNVFIHGYYGVELFFMISGFVIYYSLLKAKTAKYFLLKRAIRLFPTYWICLSITFILVSIFPLNVARNTNLFDAAIGLTMLSGLFKNIKSVDPSYWSLLIECFFYFMMAALVFLKWQNKQISSFLGVWLLLILFYNTVYKIPVIGAFFNLRYGGLFVAGICFYNIFIEQKSTINNWLLLIASYLISLVALKDLLLITPILTCIYFIFLVVVKYKFSIFTNTTLLFFGKISYALYLIHQNVGFVIIKQSQFYGVPFAVAIVFALGVSIGIASLISFYIEKPITIHLHKLLNL